MFMVGQKVACVRQVNKDSDPAWRFIVNVPQVGEAYTVTGIDIAYDAQYLYVGITNPKVDWYGLGYRAPPFWSGYFRPIVERKTDISIFKKMLEPNTHVIAGEDAWDRRVTPAMQVSWLDRQEAKMRLELSRMWKSHD